MGHGARQIRIDDDDYPGPLRALRDAPEVLHVDGTLDGLARAVGIVGTRRATPAALDFARALARALADAGIVIVSGGAEGIDAAAHEGALASERGRTIAVLPTALDRPFPAAHAGLFDRIARRGARITERATGDTPHASHFLERNRIIAALSHAVVIVQAPFRSGALRTAADARALGVPVLAVPWAPAERAAVGGLALLAQGARLCRDANDVLAAIGEPPTRPTRARRPRARVTGDDAALLAALDDVAVDRDTAFARAALDARRGQAALTRLVMTGLAHEDLLGVRRG